MQQPGGFIPYKESLSKSLKELDELKILPEPPVDGHQHIKLIVKDGMDGAGNQLKIMDSECPNMELFGYVLLEAQDLTIPVHFKIKLIGYLDKILVRSL